MKVTNSASTPESLWLYRSNVTRVVFENKLIAHETDENLIFDVSEKQDKSVMAYLLPNEENLTTNMSSENSELTDTTAYTLYLQGDTGIIANKYSSSLFYGFNNLLEIENLQNLDTSNVMSMSNFFNKCKNLTSIDLSNFDTSNVTNMAGMFQFSGFTNLDLSNFDTTNVTNMNSLFSGCHILKTTLTIRGTKCTEFDGEEGYWTMLFNAATNGNIVLNYTSDASALVDEMIKTKSEVSKVYKGVEVA